MHFEGLLFALNLDQFFPQFSSLGNSVVIVHEVFCMVRLFGSHWYPTWWTHGKALCLSFYGPSSKIPFRGLLSYSVVRLYRHASGRGFNVDNYKYKAKEEKNKGRQLLK